MAARTWYLTAATSGGWRTLSENTQAAATNTDGWVVGTGSTNSSSYFTGVERAASTFVNNTPPDGSLDTANFDAFRTENAYSGSFDAGTWVLHFVVRSVTSTTGQDGRIVFRVLKADANGANATEIATGQHVASTITDVAATDEDSTLTFDPGAFSITDQYIFIQLAWQRTGAGSMSTADVNWRTGSSSTVGTRITSANLVVVSPSASLSPSPSQTPSPSLSPSPSPSVSPSPAGADTGQGGLVYGTARRVLQYQCLIGPIVVAALASPSASVSPSASPSPSASQSPSASASPSQDAGPLLTWAAEPVVVEGDRLLQFQGLTQPIKAEHTSPSQSPSPSSSPSPSASPSAGESDQGAGALPRLIRPRVEQYQALIGPFVEPDVESPSDSPSPSASPSPMGLAWQPIAPMTIGRGTQVIVIGPVPPEECDVIRWRVYFDSGQTADNQTHAVEVVPGEGVIVIAQAHDDPTDPLRAGRQLLYDADFYYWQDGRWYKADVYGRDDYLRRPGWRKILAGRNTTTATYHALIQRAYDDPDLPVKSAWMAGERRVL